MRNSLVVQWIEDLVVMLLWVGCYSAVLTSDKFVCLFGGLIPSLSLLLVMILRMIPSLTRKAVQIADARKSVGKGTGASENKKGKVLGGMRILSALTDWALEGSIVTADSMRCRGYGCARRTNFTLYRLSVRDLLLLACIGGLSLVVMLAGGMEASYTPNLYFSYISYGFPAYCLMLLIPPVMYLWERIRWNRFKFEI